MSKYEDLKNEYEAKVRELQESCPHCELHEWMEECWAMGHSTGRMVQLCKECYKTINFMVKCSVCGKKLINNEANYVELTQGKPQTHYLQTPYCKDCILIPDPSIKK